MRPRASGRKNICAKPRRWKPSGAWLEASPTTSITCSPAFCSTAYLLIAGLKSGVLNRAVESSGSENKNNGWEPSELCQHVEEVRLAGEQGAALTQQLLAIARKQ